jgi:hypothetical protein
MPRALEGAMTDAGLLAGRLLLVFIFLHERWSILGNHAGAAAYMQKFGVPSLLLPSVIALQLGGGALIAAGSDALRGTPVRCILRAHCDPVSWAVCRPQSGAASSERPGDRRRISRSGLLRAGKLVAGPAPPVALGAFGSDPGASVVQVQYS